MKRFIEFTFIALSIILLSACSNKSPQKSNIIKDPSLLKPVPNKEDVFYYLNKSFDANDYNHVIVPEITIIVEEDDKNDINKKLLNKITSYLQENLQKELNKVLEVNTSKKALIMQISIASFDVSYDALKPWQYMPYGLAIKTILRGTGLEKRKLNTSLVFKISDKNTSQTQVLIVDYKTKEDMPSYDELNFENVKPLLDYWINNSKTKLKELNNHKYEY